MRIDWTTAHYLNADGIDTWLMNKEKFIRDAALGDETLPEDLRHWTGRWHHAPESDQQRLFDEAKAEAIRDRVEAMRATRDRATCRTCKKDFAFYWKSGWDAARLKERPKVCAKCYLEEERRRGREERLAAFNRDNPLGRHYLEHKATAPRPAQYATVMQWRQWSDDSDTPSLGLVLVGDSFTGKTTAAYQAAYQAVEKCRYEDFLAVNSGQLNTIPERVLDRSIGEFMERLQTVELLLIDDLDKVRITPRVASELWNLFEVRLRQHELPIFITLNTRTQRDFIKLFAGREAESRKIGESIYNRLRQACQFIDFDVTGK